MQTWDRNDCTSELSAKWQDNEKLKYKYFGSKSAGRLIGEME